MPTAANCSRFFDYATTEDITKVMKWDEKKALIKNSMNHYHLVMDLKSKFDHVYGEKGKSRSTLNALGYKDPFQVSVFFIQLA